MAVTTRSKAASPGMATQNGTGPVKRIEIPVLTLETIPIRLVGESDLIVHKWSSKAKREMLDSQTGAPKGPRAKKDPWMDFLDSMYWLDPPREDGTPAEWSDVYGAIFGLPSVCLKCCAVDTCSHVAGITKVEARGAFHVDNEFVIIQGEPYQREDMVRVGMGTADLRYRGAYKTPWIIDFTIRINPNILTPAQVINLFNYAGFGMGLGEWRAQKDGSFGRFHVALGDEGS